MIESKINPYIDRLKTFRKPIDFVLMYAEKLSSCARIKLLQPVGNRTVALQHCNFLHNFCIVQVLLQENGTVNKKSLRHITCCMLLQQYSYDYDIITN